MQHQVKFINIFFIATLISHLSTPVIKFIDTINHGFAVDNCGEIEFFMPCLTVEVKCRFNNNVDFDNYTLIICRELCLSDDCHQHQMFRKLIGELNIDDYYIIDASNIKYSLWMPHACLLDKKNKKSKTSCIVKEDGIQHNYKYTHNFFIGSFGCKWNNLHYWSDNYVNTLADVVEDCEPVNDLCESSDEEVDEILIQNNNVRIQVGVKRPREEPVAQRINKKMKIKH